MFGIVRQGLTGITPWMQHRHFAVANFRPKRTRFRKAFKGFFAVHKNGSLRGTAVSKGEYGLRAFEGGRLTDLQLQTISAMVRKVIKGEKGATVALRCYPHRPVTAKPAETRMGKGKGAVDHFATWIAEGQIIIETVGARKELAEKALQIAAEALPIRTTLAVANACRRAPRTVPHFIQKQLDGLNFIRKSQ